MSKLFVRLLLPFLTLFLAVLPSRLLAFELSTLDKVTIGTFYGGAAAGAAVASAGVIGLPWGALVGVPLTVGTYLGYYSVCPALTLFGSASGCVDVPSGTGANATVKPPAASATVSPNNFYQGYDSGGTWSGSMSWSDSCATMPNSCDATRECEVTTNTPTNSCTLIRWYAGYFRVGTPASSQNMADSINLHPAVTCPAGYTLSGSVCNLTDVQLASGTAHTRAVRDGVTVTLELPASTPTSIKAEVMTTDASNDTVYITNLDTNGRVMVGQFVSKSDGGTTANFYNNTGYDTYTKYSVETDSGGTVTALAQSTYSGNVSVDSAGTGQVNQVDATPVSGVSSSEHVLGDVPVSDGSVEMLEKISELGAADCGANCAVGSGGVWGFDWEWWLPTAGCSCVDIYTGGVAPSVSLPFVGSVALPDVCTTGFMQRLPEVLEFLAAGITGVSILNLFFTTTTRA